MVHGWNLCHCSKVVPATLYNLHSARSICCDMCLRLAPREESKHLRTISQHSNCESRSFNVDPTTVITDFELAATKAVVSCFGDNMRCHGASTILQRVPGATTRNLVLCNPTDRMLIIRLFCGMTDALVFIPCSDVVDSLSFL